MVKANTVSRDHYYLLSSEIENERIKAAVSLIKELQAAEDDKEWEYAFTRLIKGLASSRAAARIGFSTALSEILNIRFQQSKIDIQSYLTSLDQQLKVVRSSKKGKDERAYLFGRIFGLKALANSTLFIDTKDTNAFEKSFWEFTKQVLELALSKSWIRESCFYTLFEFLTKLITAGKASDEILKELLEQINEKRLTLSTEGLSIYLLLILHNKVDLLSKLNITNGWKHNNPLLKSNLHTLAKTLKDVEVTSAPEDDVADNDGKQTKKDKKQQKGNWSPNLHFVWGFIIRAVIKNELEDIAEESVVLDSNNKKRKKSEKTHKRSSKKQKTSTNTSASLSDAIKVKEFWKVIVDDSLFASKASPERKYWGFKVFEIFVNECVGLNQQGNFMPSQLDHLFTENFLRTLINQSGNSSRMLYNLVKKEILNTFICKSIACNPSNVKISFQLLQNFLFSPYSNLNFDNITGTKTIESLIQNIATFGNFDELKALTGLFLDVLQYPEHYLNNIEQKQLEDGQKSNKNKKSKKQDDDSSSEEEESDDDSEQNSNTNSLKQKLVEKKQKWVVNQVTLLLKFYRVRLNTLNNSFMKDKESLVGPEINNEWLDELIKTFVLYGFFKPTDEPESFNGVSNLISKKLNTLLLDIVSFKRVDNNSWLYIALKEAFSIEKEQKKLDESKRKYAPVVALDEELSKFKYKNFKALKKIIRKKSQLIENNFSVKNVKKSVLIDKLSSFELIYSIILLHFFSDADSLEDSMSLLEEVTAAYKKFHLDQEINNDVSSDDAPLSSSEDNDDEDEQVEGDGDARDAEDSSSILKKSPAANDSVEDDESFRSIDILLEIVLRFVHQKSLLSKKLSLIIWETFVTDLRYANLKSLYDILLVKENVEGQKTLFDTAEDGEGDEEDVEGDEEDEEMDEEEEDDDDDDDDDEDEDIGDDEDDEPDADSKDFLDKLDKKTATELAKALKIPTKDGELVLEGSSSDEEKSNSNDSDSSDDEENSEDEESMDDEQMMAIDNQLSLIFKQRQNALKNVKTGNKRKIEKQEAQENMIFFKNRVLDLLDIYVDKILDYNKKEHSDFGSLNNEKYLSLSLIDPLLSLMELTLSPALRDKAHKLLKKIARIRIVLQVQYFTIVDNNDNGEEPEAYEINDKVLFALLSKIHNKSHKSASPALSNAYNQFSIYLSKILILLSPDENYDKVIDIYSESLKKWVKTKNSKVNASMFYDLINYFSGTKQQPQK